MIRSDTRLTKLLSLSWLLGLCLVGCAVAPPVQEMSNARQTLQAARQANAEQFAPLLYQRAEQLMDEASVALNSGDYHKARQLALESKQQAIKARQQALSKQRE
jgi:hypothetical protein